jgi:glycine/D-amino acid oxidase-like deaminating enzyme
VTAFVDEPARRTPVLAETEVLVVGGGTAGAAAARLARRKHRRAAPLGCISVDHRAHHATKEIPACMMTGGAAGTAAALAVKQGCSPKEIDVGALQDQLRRHGAIVPVAHPSIALILSPSKDERYRNQ